MDAIFNRVSTREFTEQPVRDKDIELILRAAMQAPSAGNQQPWEFYVVTNKKLLEKLGQATKYSEPAGKAPVCIVACTRTSGLRHAAFAPQDMGACIENMMVEATDLGLGSVWMGLAPREGRMEIVRNILNLSRAYEPFALIAVGYPAEEKEPQDRFDKSRVHYLKDEAEQYVSLTPAASFLQREINN